MSKKDVVDGSAFQRVSLGSAVESLIVFAVCGFLVIVMGSFFIDLNKGLPDWYTTLIQEPVSITYFFILSLLGTGLTAAVTCLGRRDCSGKCWFDYLILAIVRAGISCGFIASGMLLGIGSGLVLITRGSATSDLAATASQFVGLGMFCLSVVYASVAIMLNLINQRKEHNRSIYTLSVIYILAIIVGAFCFDGHADKKAVSGVLAVIIAFLVINRRRLRTSPVKAPVEGGAHAYVEESSEGGR